MLCTACRTLTTTGNCIHLPGTWASIRLTRSVGYDGGDCGGGGGEGSGAAAAAGWAGAAAAAADPAAVWTIDRLQSAAPPNDVTDMTSAARLSVLRHRSGKIQRMPLEALHLDRLSLSCFANKSGLGLPLLGFGPGDGICGKRFL